MRRTQLDDLYPNAKSRQKRERALWRGLRKRPVVKTTSIDFAPSLNAKLKSDAKPRRRWRKALIACGLVACVVGIGSSMGTSLSGSGALEWVRQITANGQDRVAAFTGSISSAAKTAKVMPVEPPPPPVTAGELARVLTDPVSRNVYPTRLEVGRGQDRIDTRVEYSFDPGLQATAEGIFERYKPDYGTFVALDPESGRVLAMTSYTKSDEGIGNLAVRASFPAASVFKIVTAAAGLDQDILSPGTIIPFNGKSTALYKKHVLRHKNNKWTRNPTLVDAFAKSINPVFGRIGVFQVGAPRLAQYAREFGFNRSLDSDIDVPTSAMVLDVEDEWAVAEAASGYTQNNKLSPIHGAMMAAAIANDGIMMQPHMVSALRDDAGEVVYEPTWSVAGQPISSQTASEMRELMQATVKRGSARKPFRGFFRGKHSDIEVGGKTGTLTGADPQGRNDWFVGYAIRGDRRIAFAALCVNVEKWTVKSGRIARMAIESWFDEPQKVAAAQ